MPDERNGGVVRWPDLLHLLEGKAGVGDVNAVVVQLQGLRTEMLTHFAEVNARIDQQNKDRDEDRKQSTRDKRQMLYVFSGFGVTILATLLGTGTL